MSRYRFGKEGSASHRESKPRLIFKVLTITLIILSPFVVYIIITTLPPSPVTGRTIDKGFFDSSQTFETSWFSFRAEKPWVSVEEMTVEDKVYYYQEMQGPNPQGLLVIYVNSRPSGPEDYYTHVVPVVLNEDGGIIARNMEEHCGDAFDPPLRSNLSITQAETTFTCWAGGNILYAVAGEIGGDNILTMPRPDGSMVNFVITYRNLAFLENEPTFTKVLNTFKSR